MRTRAATCIISLIGLGLGAVTQVEAQPLRAIRPLSGYSCMALNLTEQQMFDPSAVPPVMAEPSPTARRIGSAGAIVITADPLRSQNGYVAMMMPDGKHGWIAADKLKPYRSAANPTARCIPSMMSDGRPGFTFQH
ncbi:hypothetical protein QMO56_18900 [Roseomonas sp. E05]|uniref:hypothetical protein n=1 Tax=Roseomonas sp. E05 TaxID=3046310 RepID=UPI0024BB5DEA|nr:hypothetical protein [Roseomonas sp. E05]MDJ0390183.1 hypothetical protein [Roseomonas sp. E05]